MVKEIEMKSRQKKSARCPYRHCVHDRHCTLTKNYWNWCPQWGDTLVKCQFREEEDKKRKETKNE